MENITTKKEPDIIMVSPLELTGRDVLRLKHEYETETDGFTISSRGCDVILLNREIEGAEEIRALVLNIMGRRYCDDSLTEKLLDEFEERTDRAAYLALFRIWHDWREARQQADRKEQAEWYIREFKNQRLALSQKKKGMLQMLFHIGYGLYDGNHRCDFETGQLYCYLYGYMCGKGLLK
ncbi:MAG: hypothetical protein K2I22_03085 [Lachnospiraceae bacterium]|nr:hypothetical protein [Lachnospiraceae bacterium]